MTSNTVPVYRHGRKFYVSANEYERLRSEERKLRRTALQKSQNLPIPKSPQIIIRSPSTSLYKPIQRSNTNPHEYKYGILKTPHTPDNQVIIPKTRSAVNRLSRSTLRHHDNHDDLPSIPKKKSSPTSRSNSSNKVTDILQTPNTSLSFYKDNQVKRSLSADMKQSSSSSSASSHRPEKPKQKSHRIFSTTISDYGISPISTISMTPTDQTYTQTDRSKLTSYLARMKESTLNPPSTVSATGSIFQTGIQGTDHVYTVLGTSNRRIGTGSSSLLTRSTSDSSKNEYSDDSSSLLSMLYQRQNRQQFEYLTELDNDSNQQRDLWTRSTIRSQSSDGLTEKKRVRFADMEGFTLETIPDKKHLKSSPIHTRFLTRQQPLKLIHNSRETYSNGFLQRTSKIKDSKLATDV